jgi:hypothetical protein
METAYNLPDFDTLGHSLELAFEVLSSVKARGELLFWNPGQGHVPVYIEKKQGSEVAGIRLASRDSLEIAMAEWNLRAIGRQPRESFAISSESGLKEVLGAGSVDLFCAAPKPVPGAPWNEEMAETASFLVKDAGELLVVGKSTDVFRLLERLKGFRLQRGKKRFGYRAVLLRKS